MEFKAIEKKTKELKDKVKKDLTQAGKFKDMEPGPESETYETTTVKMKTGSLEKIRAFAYWERLTVQEAISKAVDMYFENIPIKPRPESERIKEQQKRQNMNKSGKKIPLANY